MDEIKKLQEKATKNNLNLVSYPIRHLGTEKAHSLYQKLEEYIDTLPEQFYSETYNKMNEEKDSYDILNTTNIEKIERDYCTKKDKIKLTYNATDNYDGDLSKKVKSVISKDKSKITYSVVDQAGNIGKVERKIFYKDRN